MPRSQRWSSDLQVVRGHHSSTCWATDYHCAQSVTPAEAEQAGFEELLSQDQETPAEMGLRLRRMQRQSKAQDTADRLMRRMEGAGQPLTKACGGIPVGASHSAGCCHAAACARCCCCCAVKQPMLLPPVPSFCCRLCQAFAATWLLLIVHQRPRWDTDETPPAVSWRHCHCEGLSLSPEGESGCWGSDVVLPCRCSQPEELQAAQGVQDEGL